jgi:branched-chain amino acid transport system permease protein
MVIIGGLGSLLGSFLGAIFILNLPILLRAAPGFFSVNIAASTVEHIQFMIVGGLIIFFLIVEPLGFARLWQITKEKLRRWPFPY